MSQSISIKDLHQKMNKLGKNEVILDVRGSDEYADGHIPGSINIPHDEVTKYVEKLKQYERVYIHCHAGRRAQMAFSALESVGLTNLICVADGGMGDWIAAGFETVKGS